MSRFSHRQPTWTWTSMVVLSTLLLAPGISVSVAASLIGALVHALPQQVAAERGTATTPLKSAATQQPRRSTEEEDALRAAAGDSAAYIVRFDTDPNHPDGITASLAILLPTRAVVRVPDCAALAALPVTDAPYWSSPLRDGLPPRAPPAA